MIVYTLGGPYIAVQAVLKVLIDTSFHIVILPLVVVEHMMLGTARDYITLTLGMVATAHCRAARATPPCLNLGRNVGGLSANRMVARIILDI